MYYHSFLYWLFFLPSKPKTTVSWTTFSTLQNLLPVSKKKGIISRIKVYLQIHYFLAILLFLKNQIFTVLKFVYRSPLFGGCFFFFLNNNEIIPALQSSRIENRDAEAPGICVFVKYNFLGHI